MCYTITNGILEITADALGAELVSVKHRGVERLWQNGNGSWSGHAPILFPVCGSCAVVVDGRRYDMPQHGFAKSSEFTLAARGVDFLRFELSANDRTREIYPFEFVFAVEYRLSGERISILYSVESRGAPVCFACGGHESYAVKDVAACKLVFEEPTRLIHSKHDPSGRLTGERVDFGTVTEFDRLAEYLQNGDTLIFGDIEACAVELVESGKKRAKVTFDGFSNLLVWRSVGADMICIEPWTVLPDEAGAVPSELSDRRGICTATADRPFVLSRTIEYY